MYVIWDNRRAKWWVGDNRWSANAAEARRFRSYGEAFGVAKRHPNAVVTYI